MDHTFRFFTDTATLAVFDPEQLGHRVSDDVDWWCSGFVGLDEVQSGKIALVSLGGDDIYQARITDQELTPDERDYASEVVSNLAATITSGKLFAGPGECLPGGESSFGDSDATRGIVCELRNGDYSIDVYDICWHDSPRWWTEGKETPEDAPPDFVIVLRTRTKPMIRLDNEPRLLGDSDSFLFDTLTRRVGPEPGMTIETKVRKGPEGLCLKDCGPKSYRAELVDYSPVEWKDFIRFKAVSVDHDRGTIIGEFIEKIESV